MLARTDQKWSPALIRRMARLADQEMSTAQIAKALGLTRGQVLGKMHRLDLKTKNPPRKWLNTALFEKLTELTDQRLSAGQIGQALGLTRAFVLTLQTLSPDGRCELVRASIQQRSVILHLFSLDLY